MSIQKIPSFGENRRGFTLIEITFALGVISVAFVGLLGLLPLGMQTFRSAVDTSIRTQIAQRVVSDAMQTGFTNLVSTPPSDRFFDDQGNEVSQSPSLYHVRVRVSPSTDLPSQSTSETNADLATVQVRIAPNPRHLADPYSDSKTLVFETAAFVARNEYP